MASEEKEEVKAKNPTSRARASSRVSQKMGIRGSSRLESVTRTDYTSSPEGRTSTSLFGNLRHLASARKIGMSSTCRLFSFFQLSLHVTV